MKHKHHQYSIRQCEHNTRRQTCLSSTLFVHTTDCVALQINRLLTLTRSAGNIRGLSCYTINSATNTTHSVCFLPCLPQWTSYYCSPTDLRLIYTYQVYTSYCFNKRTKTQHAQGARRPVRDISSKQDTGFVGTRNKRDIEYARDFVGFVIWSVGAPADTRPR